MSDAFHRSFWGEPEWVNEGDTVRLIVERFYDTGKVRAPECRVVVAAGKHARVVNEEKQIDKWVALSSLLVAPDDLRHSNQRDATWRLIREAL